MLIEHPKNSLGWSVVARPTEEDMAIILKSPSVLPSTLLWYSNGGRFYGPWDGRHTGVLGVEECCSYFGYGHAASIADNALSREGIATAIDLTADIEIKSVIGASTQFWKDLTVGAVVCEDDHLVISNSAGDTRLPFDPAFLNQ